MQDLTERQSEIYNFIQEYRKKHGYSPSRQEIAEGLNIHISTLRSQLYSMGRKNIITWDEKIPRSIMLIEQLV